MNNRRIKSFIEGLRFLGMVSWSVAPYVLGLVASIYAVFYLVSIHVPSIVLLLMSLGIALWAYRIWVKSF